MKLYSESNLERTVHLDHNYALPAHIDNGFNSFTPDISLWTGIVFDLEGSKCFFRDE